MLDAVAVEAGLEPGHGHVTAARLAALLRLVVDGETTVWLDPAMKAFQAGEMPGWNVVVSAVSTEMSMP